MRSPGRQAKASEASPRGQVRDFAGRYDQTMRRAQLGEEMAAIWFSAGR